jgi:hypothetical protein
MRRTSPALAVGVALLVALLVVVGSATAPAKTLSDEELVDEAGFVVVGTVTNVEGRWSDDGTQIFTFVDVDVEETLKGRLDGSKIRLRLLGGEADGIGMALADAPHFAAKEEVLLFLTENPQSLFPIVGNDQGKLELTREPATGGRMVPRRAARLDDFADRIRGIARTQAARQRPPRGRRPAPMQPKRVQP